MKQSTAATVFPLVGVVLSIVLVLALMASGKLRTLISKLVPASLAILALSACTSPEKNHLPPYAQRDADGTVRVDLEMASNGSARLNLENEIELSFNDSNLRFDFRAMSGALEIGRKSLDDPPLKISPVLSPGDGVADFFAVAWMEGDPPELHIDVFIDTDWRDEIGDDISIHSQDIVDRRVSLGRIPVDFSESVQGVYNRELVFVGVEDFLRGGGPHVFVTNIGGETIDFLNAVGRLDLEKGDVYASLEGITGPVVSSIVEPGINPP